MMMKHAVGTAVAAVFATAMVGAQTTGTGTATGQQTQRATGQQQMMTVVGCLQRDATVTADAGDRTFMLVNAEVRSGDTATGTAGQPGAQPGAQPGTQQPGTQAGQPGQQPGTQPGQQPDTATGTTPGVAGTTGMAASGGTKFKVTGLDEERLRQYDGQRVQINGTIEHDKDRTDAGSTGQYGRPGTSGQTGQTGQTGQSGQTKEPGQTAQAGQTGQPGQPGQAGQHDHTRAAAGDVAELKATSIQASAGTCPPQASR